MWYCIFEEQEDESAKGFLYATHVFDFLLVIIFGYPDFFLMNFFFSTTIFTSTKSWHDQAADDFLRNIKFKHTRKSEEIL